MTEFFTTTVDDSGDIHGQVSLVAGNANLPVIAYTTQSGEVRLAQQTPEGEWIITTPPCGTAARDEYRISLDLDSRSEPHIALVNAASDRLIYGARREQWDFEEVPTEGGLFPGSVRFPSMKLYKGFREVFDEFKDAPHIAYQAGLELRHAAKLRPRDDIAAEPVPGADPVWKKHVDTIDTASPEAGWFATCDISTDDTLRVAYFDDLSSLGRTARRLRVATMRQNEQFIDRPAPEAGWFTEEVDMRDISGAHPSLAQSVNGAGAVSYLDQLTQTLNLGMIGNPLGPSMVETVTNQVSPEGVRSSVAQSHQFKWCVTYGFEGRLKFATRTAPETFVIEDADAGGEWPSMLFDGEGNAQIAHVAGGSLKFVVAPREDD